MNSFLMRIRTCGFNRLCQDAGAWMQAETMEGGARFNLSAFYTGNAPGVRRPNKASAVWRFEQEETEEKEETSHSSDSVSSVSCCSKII